MHLFVYHQLRRTLEEVSGPTPSDETTSIWSNGRSGRALRLGTALRSMRYDGDADSDVETLLTLYYLDGFQATPARAAPREPSGRPGVAGSDEGDDNIFLAYLGTYRDLLLSILALIGA